MVIPGYASHMCCMYRASASLPTRKVSRTHRFSIPWVRASCLSGLAVGINRTPAARRFFLSSLSARRIGRPRKMPFQVRDPTLAMVKQDLKVSPLQKDGTVPVSELRSIFHRLDKWTDDELTELIADSKQESNGMVNINAFVDWLYGETDASKRKAPFLVL